MRKRKWAAAAMAFLLVVSCGGCGKKEASSEAGTEAATETNTDFLLSQAEQEDTSVDAPVFVKRIDNLSEDFICGVDVSSLLSEYESGVTYCDYEGNALDMAGFFRFLYEESGVNYVRLRVWVDPYDAAGNSYGGGNCDLETAGTLGKLATDAGMRVLIDFHYSDFWADPGKQRAPKAWEGMSLSEKKDALKAYTKDSLSELISGGVDVGMVQIGNETTKGIAGESDWDHMCQLFQAGSEGVRETSPDIQVMLHFTNPESGSYPGICSRLEEAGVDYDIFGSSYYPYWHGEPGAMKTILSTIVNQYHKKVMIVETSYIHTWEDGDGSGNTESEGKAGDAFYYDTSEQGQCDAIREAANCVAFCGEDGLGIFYWEPAWIPVGVVPGAEDPEAVYETNKTIWETKGSGWASSFASDYDADAAKYYGGSAVDNEAWFDFEGHPLASARIYKYIRSGAKTELAVVAAAAEDVTLESGQALALPVTVQVRMNDGTVTDEAVTWDEEQVSAVDMNTPGEYSVSGNVSLDGKNIPVEVLVRVQAENLLLNPGFEEEDMSMWTISNPVLSRKDDKSNVRNGEYCLHFWDSNDFEFTAEQTVTLDAGEYVLGTYLEGGDCGGSPVFELYILEPEGEKLVQNTGVTQWQEWQNPEIDGIQLEEDGSEVTIGIHVKASGGGWGAWDDFYLYQK